MLGRLSLALVTVTTVVATISMGPVATILGQLMVAMGTTDIDSTDAAAAVSASASGSMAAFQLATVVGIAAAITGLVAAIINRGRAAGIFAILLGLLAPVVVGIYMAIVLAPIIGPLR